MLVVALGAMLAVALGAMLVVALGAVLVVAPAAAQAADGPTTCPTEVDGQPLALTAPFSGTVRVVAGADGEIVRRSLRCVYGEGVTPSVDLTITWSPGGACSTDATEVPEVDAAAVDRAVARLARGLGGLCPSATAPAGTPSDLPLVGVAAALLSATVTLGGIVLVRARRRRPEPAAEPVRPDVRPVLALLSADGGAAYARTAAGQLASVAALAYGRSAPALGDLARVASARVRPAHRPADPDVAVLAARIGGHDA